MKVFEIMTLIKYKQHRDRKADKEDSRQGESVSSGKRSENESLVRCDEGVREGSRHQGRKEELREAGSI